MEQRGVKVSFSTCLKFYLHIFVFVKSTTECTQFYEVHVALTHCRPKPKKSKSVRDVPDSYMECYPGYGSIYVNIIVISSHLHLACVGGSH